MSKSTAPNVRTITSMLKGAAGRRLDALRAVEVAAPTRFRNGDSSRAVTKLLAPRLRDRAAAAAFADVLEQDRAKLDAAVRKSRAAAIKGSRGRQQMLKAQAAQRLRSLKGLTGLPATAAVAQYELLNKPFLIWPTNSIDLEASEIVPSNSWAKFRAGIGSGKRFSGNVKFYYLWRNERDAFAVINVDGYAIFHGYAYIGSDGGFWPGDRWASLAVDGRLEILEWWNQPPTSPPSQPDQSVNVLSLSVDTGGFSEVGAIEARDIFRGYDLRHTMMVVPPQAVLVFTVTAEVRLGTGSDGAVSEIDFASGSFQVGSPAVLVSVLT